MKEVFKEIYENVTPYDVSLVCISLSMIVLLASYILHIAK